MNEKGRWNVVYGKTYFDCKMNDDISGGHHIFFFYILVNDMGSLGEMYMAMIHNRKREPLITAILKLYGFFTNKRDKLYILSILFEIQKGLFWMQNNTSMALE